MAVFDLSMPEAWYTIPDAPGYEISSHFRVRSYWTIGRKSRLSIHPQRYLAITIDKDGYSRVSLKMGGAKLNLRVHQIVALIAHGPCPDGAMVLHKDDVKSNNTPANLYYGTGTQNRFDARRNGKDPVGSQRWNAKLHESDIPGILELLESGMSQRKVAARYNVSRDTLRCLLRGQSWAHVTGFTNG